MSNEKLLDEIAEKYSNEFAYDRIETCKEAIKAAITEYAALAAQNPDKDWSMDYGGGPAPTPETDKAVKEGSLAPYSYIELASRLERERDEARRDTLDNTLVLAKHAEEQMLRAEKLEAALAERDAEIERLRESVTTLIMEIKKQCPAVLAIAILLAAKKERA
tara:strand:+ start:350 stop:838 length:489 start_codon:yes stop_codon:yes gene_type:complete